MPESSVEQLFKIRHSLAHLLAMAVLEQDSNAKFGTGPVTENGFYYDILLSEGVTVSEKDFKKLEKSIRGYIARKLDFTRKEVSAEEAKKIFAGQPLKLELIDEILARGETITVYETGNFIDLCEGPHVANTSEITPDAFMLTRVAGAYWKADENNRQLLRIAGIAFENKDGLDTYLHQQEEAKKRDHRKIGKEMDLFTFSTLVGAGLPLFTPKGTILRSELQSALLKISEKYGMQLVTIPHIAKRELYEVSGHATKFADELIKVISHYDEFVMKPVNCPHHTQIYASRPRSYRDLPLRYMESTMQYRDEQPGEISGLTRVRAITVDDGHIFCRVHQIKDEARNIANIIKEFYSGLGMYGHHWVSLSVRDQKTPDKYIGEDADWQKAEEMLQDISEELHLNAKRMEGEAALYGPKLDYMFIDSMGRERQLATIQIDFAMPKRFKLTYINEKGQEETPVMIHRAILGSYERFLAILIEHFAGAFPLWLSPVQAWVVPISQAHHDYAQEVFQILKQQGLRVELHDENDSLGKKIRESKLQKIPYIFVIGDKEVESKTITIESRDQGKVGALSIEEVVAKLQDEIRNKTILQAK